MFKSICFYENMFDFLLSLKPFFSIHIMFFTLHFSPCHLLFVYYIGRLIRRCFNISIGLLLAYLSIPVVQNLLSSRQFMNTSFDPLRIVNTYGAFGR